jgi:uroporphyrinogen-III synthase
MTPAPRIVVTREAADAGAVLDALEREGFDGWAVPTIAIEPPPDPRPLEAALADLSRFDWLAFTSGHAVRAVCTWPSWSNRWEAARARVRVAAAGPGTAARLIGFGVPVAATAAPGGARALASTLETTTANVTGKRILWPRGDLASTAFRDRLASRGADVVAPIAYTTQSVPVADLAPLVAALSDGAVQGLTFFSPSSAHSLARVLGGTLSRLAGQVTVAAIGPTTAEALAVLGAPADVVAPVPTAGALAQALARHFSRSGATV